MVAEDTEDMQNEKRVGLKRKPTGPLRLLRGRTRTRSAEEDPPETKPTGSSEETLAACSDELTCRGRPHAACDRRRRRRWWSRLSSAVVCIRRPQEDNGSAPEGAPQKDDGVLLQDIEESRKTDLKNMRNILKIFTSSPDVQQRPDLSRRSKPSPSFQTKLRKFFVGAGKRRSDPLGNVEDMKVEEDPCVSEATERPGEHSAVLQQTEHQEAAKEPEPSQQTTAKDHENGSDMFQAAHVNQVLVRDVSSEEDEVLFDSELVVDLHDQPPFELSFEKIVQVSRPLHPFTNGPSIRIELYPPDDIPQEEEEEEDGCWEGVSSSENHLLHLVSSDHSERQLLTAARSLVRTAVTAAVDQLTREQQNNGDSILQEPQGCR